MIDIDQTWDEVRRLPIRTLAGLRRPEPDANADDLATALLAEAAALGLAATGPWNWRGLGEAAAVRWPEDGGRVSVGLTNWLNASHGPSQRYRDAQRMLRWWMGHSRSATDPRPLAAMVASDDPELRQRVLRYHGAASGSRSARGAPPKSPDGPRDVRLSTRVPSSLLEEIDSVLADDESRADLVEAAIRAELERRK